MAGNTPFKRWKREVHEGGVADPCIVSAPGLTDRGGTRRQFAHAIDVMPTILELAGIEVPAVVDGIEQSRVDGVSFAPVLKNADAPETHETQHFEMLGSRGIYHRGWKAVTFHPLGAMYDDGLDPDAPFDDDVWELYDVDADPSETNDVAAAEPERLAAMVDLWWEEAARNDVLPLDNRPLFAILNPRPTTRQSRTTYVYYPNGAPVPEAVAVNVRNRSHTITASITVARGAVPEGTLLALGSVLGGFTFQIVDGRLRYVHNLYGARRDVVESKSVVAPGAHRVAFAFTKTAEFTGRGELLVDDQVVGAGDIAHFTPMTFSYTGGGLTCGYEVGPPIGDGYEAPFRANVAFDRVVVDVAGTPHRDPAAEYDAIMSEQ
jgi:arylsulfatase